MKTVRMCALFREAGILATLRARVQMRVDISIQSHKSRLHKQVSRGLDPTALINNGHLLHCISWRYALTH